MIPRTLFSPEHETFRDSVRRFLEEEVAPHDERYQEQGYVDKDVWKKAGANTAAKVVRRPSRWCLPCGPAPTSCTSAIRAATGCGSPKCSRTPFPELA